MVSVQGKMESFCGSMVSGDPSVLQFNPLWFHDEAQWCQDEFLGHQNEFNGFIMFSKALLKGTSLIQRGASTAPDSTVQERPPQLHVEPAQLQGAPWFQGELLLLPGPS
jgi:hypothetical protein